MLRAGQAERRVHKSAQRCGLNLDIDITYHEIPMCTDKDTQTVEMVAWPFLLPNDLATRILLVNLCHLYVPNWHGYYLRFFGICFIHTQNIISGSFEVRGMIDGGFLKLLVPDLSCIPEYWNNLLLDFPDHPAHTCKEFAVPLTLYGPLDSFGNLYVIFLGAINNFTLRKRL